MLSSKEFMDRLKDDEAFSKEVASKLISLKDKGSSSYVEAIVEVAKEYDYGLDAEEVRDFLSKAPQQEAPEGALNDEELENVAGGSEADVRAYFGGYMPCFTNVGPVFWWLPIYNYNTSDSSSDDQSSGS